MRYNLTSLEVFVAVAEECNLTKAATRCHLAPSAVSKRITELEEQVRAPLFVRYPRGMGLTPAGQSMLHHARKLMMTMQLMDEELSEYASGIKGHVRIHAITSALNQFLPTDLADFVQRYPLIKLDIEERVGAAIVRAVADGRADVGIFASHTPAQGLQVFPYRHDELVIAVPKHHPLAGSDSITFRTALDYEFVGPHLESSLHVLMESMAKQEEKPVRQRIRVSGFDCLCRMVAAGLGIGLLPRTILEPHLATMPLLAIRLDEPWVSRTLVLGVRDFETLPYTARALVDQLRLRP